MALAVSLIGETATERGKRGEGGTKPWQSCGIFCAAHPAAEKPQALPSDVIEAAALQELEASGDISISAAAAIRLLLLTGARVGEILSARWEWIDWSRRVLRLPDSKTGAKEIFLNDQLLLVLTGLMMIDGSSANPRVIRAHQRAHRRGRCRSGADRAPSSRLLKLCGLIPALMSMSSFILQLCRPAFSNGHRHTRTIAAV